MLSRFFLDFPYLATFVSFAIGAVCMPTVVRVAKRRGFVVKSNKRSSHKGAVPNIGGINVFIAFFLATSFCFHHVTERLHLVFVGMFIILLVGFVDDLIDIRVSWKLAGQLFSSFFPIVMVGFRLTSFQGFLGIYELPWWVSYALSFFVFIALNNALNLIDGVDGLASGLGMLYCLFFGVYFALTGDAVFALCAFSLIGALAVFFIYNVFGRSNKIFMGDCGSLFLGFMLYLFVCRFCQMNATGEVASAYAMSAAPAVAICVLIVPLFDTVRVMFDRIKEKRSPFYPDRCHIHHLLLDIGLEHRRVTFVLLGVNALFVAIGVMGRNWPIGLLVATGIVIMTAFTYVLKRIANKNNAGRQEKTQ